MIEFESLHHWLVSLPRPFKQPDPFANTGALALKDKELDLFAHTSCWTMLKYMSVSPGWEGVFDRSKSRCHVKPL